MKRLSVVGLAFLLSGCGYALVGRANFLPPDIETVQVPAFVNRTTRVELEQRVTSWSRAAVSGWSPTPRTRT